MNPHVARRLIGTLIVVQMLAIVGIILATVAAVVLEFPLYLMMIILGLISSYLLFVSSRSKLSGVIIFALSGIIFSVSYYLCIYVLNLSLSPLYLFVLAYAVVSLGCGFWLMSRLR